MRKLVTTVFILIIAIISMDAQSCFTPIWNGNGIDQMNFYITSATVNSSNLQIGDEIGIFDGVECVGVGVLTQVLTGGAYLSIITSKDDPDTPIKDGFTPGNPVTFKLCLNSGISIVTDVSVNYTSGSGVFSGSGTASAELTGTAEVPTAPLVGTITQPGCGEVTGSVILDGLPSSGTWTLIRMPGGITTSGSGNSTTITGLTAGTYTYTVTNSTGFTSPPTGNIIINSAPSIPSAPIVGTITQPTCALATGSVALSGLPSGSWTINPGSIAGSGTTTTLSGLTTGTHNFTVTDEASTCTSVASGNIVINSQPSIPSAPIVGTITQPTCALATGSVALSGLPSGSWTINPGSIAGSGATTTLSGLTTGTHNFTVTDEASTCTSVASGNIVINSQPSIPSAPIVGTITQPTCALATGSVALSGLPSGSWTINPGSIAGSGTTTTLSGLTTGTHNFTVTDEASTCTSVASGNIVINSQPSIPSAPIVGTITQPTCALATGSVALSGLPSGSWTINPGSIAGSGTTTTLSGLTTGTHNFTVTDEASTCTSVASGNIVINSQPSIPSAPIVGTITQPTCALATGSVALSGLPSGSWTINPGSIAGSGTTTTLSGLPTGTHNFTVTDEASTCTSVASGNIVINSQPSIPSAPIVGTITQPTCALATGSVALSGLPSGSWTINPGSIAGSGTTTTLSGLTTGTHNFTVTDGTSTCTSAASGNVVINSQPSIPSAPIVGTITQPTCASATGSVALSGLPSGSWTINPGSIAGSGATTTLSGLTTGTHNFTVTDETTTCTSVASGNIVINSQPSIPSAPIVGTITQPTCALATGSVALSGLPSGSWTINPGSIAGSGTTTTLSGLTTGTHNFTVTDGTSTCTSAASGNVVINSQPSIPSAPIVGTITQPTCASATGSVALSGLPSGSWTINPGSIAGSGATTTLSGLTTGTHNFTVTDETTTCTSVASGNIVINSQPSIPSAPIVGTITQPTCALATGSVALSGLPSGSWTINPGSIAGSETTTTLSGLPTGTHNFTVTDEASTCTSVASGNIVINSQPSIPSAPIVGTITQPTCALATGSVALSGLPSGSWTINPGSIAGSGTTTTLSGLPTGTHNFTVTDEASTCTSVASGNIVINSQPSIPSAPIVGTITQPTCALATGSVALSGLPSGSWTINPGSIAGSGTTTTLSGLTTGTHNFTVTDGTSTCTSAASASVVIDAQPSLPVAAAGTSSSICSGSGITIGAAAVGGSTYSWTSVPAGFTSSLSNPTVSPTVTTTYAVVETITATGCSKSNSVVITVNPLPTITITTAATCAADLSTYSVGATVSSGILTSTLGTVTNLGGNVWSISLVPSGIGITLSVTDGNGCSKTLPVTAPDCSCPVIASPVSGGDKSYCSGSTIPAITASVLAGETVDWFAGSTGGSALSTGTSYTPSSAGTYYAEARNTTTNCKSSSRTPVTITVNPLPVAAAGTSSSICSGSGITIGAAAVGGSTYSWTSVPAGFTSSLSNPTVSPTVTTTYAVVETITATGCSKSNSVVITVNPLPTITITTAATCAADLSTYSVGATVSSGILTSTLGTVTNLGGNVWSISLVPSGIGITLSVTDGNGCSKTLPVTAPDCSCPVIASPVSGGDKSYCSGSTIPAITASVLAGETVDWFAGSTGGSALSTGTSYTPSSAGTYYAEARNTTTNCKSSSRTPVTITVNPLPAAAAGTSSSICSGSGITIGAAAVGGSTYSWTSVPAGFTSSVSNPTVSPTVTTTYTVVETITATGCSKSNSVVITVNPLPTITITTAATCAADLSTYSVGATVSSGILTSTLGTVTNLGGNVWSISLVPSGIGITLSVTDGNGCSKTLPVTAPDCSCPVIASPVSGGDKSYCSGSTIPAITASVLAGETVDWFAGSTGGSALSTGTSYTPSSAGTYYAEARNTTTNCKSSSRTPVTITVNPLPAAAAGTSSSICSGSGITIGAAAVGGSTYSWTSVPAGFTSSVSNPTVSPTVTTTYTVVETITATGCSKSNSVVITVNPLPTITITTAATCAADLSTYSVGATVSSGILTSTLGTVTNLGGNVWSISLVPSGIGITLSVTDGNGCSKTLPVTAPDCSCPVIASPVSGGDKSYCSGSTIPAITASVLAGETVDWFAGSTGGSALSTGTSYTPSSAGTYYAEARNTTTNCKSSSRTPVTITVNPLPAAAAGTSSSICSGSGITIGAAAVGGSTYSWTSVPAGFTSSVSNPTVSPTVTTTYTVVETITATGCSKSNSVVITVNPLPTITITTAATCAADLSTYSVGATVSSGILTSTLGTVTNLGGNVWSISLVPSGIGITLSVTDGNGCSKTLPVTAPDCSCPVIASPVSGGDKSYCSGSTIPAITASVLAGETVDWFAGSTGGSALSTGTSYTPSSAGTYYAEARNTTTNCKSSSRTPVTITVNPLPAAAAGTSSSICSGSGITIGAAAVGGSTYSWTSVPAGFTSSLSNPTVSPTVTTTYTVVETITATGCSKSNSVVITVNPLPAAAAGTSSSICSGSGITIGAAAVGGSTYSWTSVPAGFTSSLSNPTVSPTVTTTYTVVETITATGCSKSNSVVITVNPLPTITITTAATCAADLSTYSVGATVSSGILTSTLGTVTNLGGNVWSISLVPSGIGITLSVTDGNGCSKTLPVTAPDCSCPVIASPVSGGDKSYCSGSTIPAITASVLAGETVDWFAGSTGGSALSTGTSYTPSSAGTYYAEARNTTTNCKSSSRTPVTITVNPLPAAAAGTSSSICSGSGITIGAAAVGGSTYSWTSVPAGFTSSLSNPTVSPTVTTTYTVVETITATGCSKSNSVVITVNPLPAAAAGTSSSICSGSGITIGAAAVGGSTYSWTSVPAGFTSSVSNPTVSPTVTTTYTVVETITATGCSKSNSVVITVNPLPSVNPITGGASTVNVGASTPPFIDATAGGIWSITPGSGTASIETDGVVTGLTAGTVTVAYTYTNSCGSAVATYPLTVNVIFSMSFIPGWNWFSVNTQMSDMSLGSVLPSVNTNGDYIKNQTSSATYYTGYGWFGTLTVIDPTKLYLIKVQNNINISFSGIPVNCSSTSIGLVTGWNWIGYLPQTALTVTDALSSLSVANLDYIKNQTKSSTYYTGFGWFGSLTNLSPSEGYMIKLASPGTLKYPDVHAKKSEDIFVKTNDLSFNSGGYEYNGSVTASVYIDGVIAGSENDRIFAYVDNEIRGETAGYYFDPAGLCLFPIMIFSNLSDGELISFKYYDGKNDKLYSCDNTLTFTKDMIVADAFKPFALNINKNMVSDVKKDGPDEMQLNTYPNPFDHILNIEYNISKQINVRITIYDSYGRIIKVLVNEEQNPDHYLIHWEPYLQSGGMYLIKLQIGDKQIIRKVILNRKNT